MSDYPAAVAWRVTKISQRRLDYWDSIGLVSPSSSPADGKGSARRYTFQDIVRLAVVARLREAGLRLQKIRKGLALLGKQSGSQQGDPLLCAVLSAQGKSMFRRVDASTLEDVLAGGQMVFSIAIDQVERHTEQRIRAEEARGMPRRGRRTG
jgi:DNA-binding transcriptional MerR regulator